jgi:hypothetical protein
MVLKNLDKKKMHRSLGAIGGFTSAIAVIVGTLAAWATPHGWARVTMALHMTKRPFILKLAPLLTGLSVAIVTAVGIMGFYIWLVDREESDPESPPESPAS